jgi:hypothetical protein
VGQMRGIMYKNSIIIEIMRKKNSNKEFANVSTLSSALLQAMHIGFLLKKLGCY